MNEKTKKNLLLLKQDPAAQDEYQSAMDGMMGQWWRALRFSNAYAAALRGERGEPWANVAVDFGELYDTFASWWVHKGMDLFGRTIATPTVRKMTVDEQVIEHPDRPTLHLAIPLVLNRQALTRQVNQLVDEARAKLGLDAHDEDWAPRRDFYKDTRLHLPTIKKMLDVWEARRDTGLSWEQIGEKFAVSEAAMPSLDDDEKTAKEKRRVMIISTQRLHRMATALIDFAARGDFPRVK
jgi:hypothetical protein